MDTKTFFQGMGALALNFRPEPSKERDELYRRALDDLDGTAFLAAVGEIVRRDHYFPPVARIREATVDAERRFFEREIFARALLAEGRSPEECRALLEARNA